MIYKTYRATNPVRWRDGDGWQVGWRLFIVGEEPTSGANRWDIGDDESGYTYSMAMVSVWGSTDPIFVPEADLEEMPMREEEKSPQSATWGGCKWAANPPFEGPIETLHAPHSQAVINKARAEANDLMQRLTESQQEVAKWKSTADTNSRSVHYLAKLLQEETAELAEVKAERDRLHEEACALRAENESHKANFRKVVIRNERLEGIVKLIRSSLACE